MDCKIARLTLAVAHPLATQLDPRDREELAGHLADCPDCGPWAESEQRLDECLGSAMLAVPTPLGLEQRILGRLRVERVAWYRRVAVRTTAAAAVLLLTLGLGYALWWHWKSAVDINGISEHVVESMYSAEQVEKSFAVMGVEMTAPPQFNYEQLESHWLGTFQGKQVPYLLFVYPGSKDTPAGVAEVYVLSARQFNIADPDVRQFTVAGTKKTGKSLHHPDPAQHDVIYFVIYTAGTPLDFFLRPLTKTPA